MAQITGVITALHAGREVRLTLGMSGLARLQEEYGTDLQPLVSMFEEKTMPQFAVLLRVTQLALERHHPDAEEWLADDLLAADITLPVRIINAVFEGLQAQGNGKELPGNGGKGAEKAASRGKPRKG